MRGLCLSGRRRPWSAWTILTFLATPACSAPARATARRPTRRPGAARQAAHATVTFEVLHRDWRCKRPRRPVRQVGCGQRQEAGEFKGRRRRRRASALSAEVLELVANLDQLHLVQLVRCLLCPRPNPHSRALPLVHRICKTARMAEIERRASPDSLPRLETCSSTSSTTPGCGRRTTRRTTSGPAGRASGSSASAAPGSRSTRPWRPTATRRRRRTTRQSSRRRKRRQRRRRRRRSGGRRRGPQRRLPRRLPRRPMRRPLRILRCLCLMPGCSDHRYYWWQ